MKGSRDCIPVSFHTWVVRVSSVSQVRFAVHARERESAKMWSLLCRTSDVLFKICSVLS